LGAGAIVGVLVGGVGGRAAMRLIAVGQGRTLMWSVSGSLTVVFVATLFGIGAGILYAFVRPHLPGEGLRRALLFGVVIQVIGLLFDFPLPKRPSTGTFVYEDVVARVVLAVLFFVAVWALEVTMSVIESPPSLRAPVARKALATTALALLTIVCVAGALWTAYWASTFGLAPRPALSPFQTALRLAIVAGAIVLWRFRRDAIERSALACAVVAAGSSALFGFGLRSTGLDVVRLLFHFLAYTLGVVVSIRWLSATNAPRPHVVSQE
jgi:hypothetical protein